jgi:hypothetical protein
MQNLGDSAEILPDPRSVRAHWVGELRYRYVTEGVRRYVRATAARSTRRRPTKPQARPGCQQEAQL